MWISTLIRERTENLLMRFSSSFSSSSFSLFLVFFSITKVTRKTKKRHEKKKKKRRRKEKRKRRKTRKKNWLSDGAPLRFLVLKPFLLISQSVSLSLSLSLSVFCVLCSHVRHGPRVYSYDSAAAHHLHYQSRSRWTPGTMQRKTSKVDKQAS